MRKELKRKTKWSNFKRVKRWSKRFCALLLVQFYLLNSEWLSSLSLQDNGSSKLYFSSISANPVYRKISIFSGPQLKKNKEKERNSSNSPLQWTTLCGKWWRKLYLKLERYVLADSLSFFLILAKAYKKKKQDIWPKPGFKVLTLNKWCERKKIHHFLLSKSDDLTF